MILNDSPGFSDPNISDAKLWNRSTSEMFTGEMRENLEKHGVSSVILPIMMSAAARLTAAQIVIVY